MAFRAFAIAHVYFVVVAHHRTGRLKIEAVDFRLDAFDISRAMVFIAAYRSNDISKGLIASEEDDFLLIFAQVLKRNIEINFVLFAQEFKFLPIDVFAVDNIFIIANCTLHNRQIIIWNEQIESRFAVDAETFAFRTIAERSVKREEARFEFWHRKAAVFAAVMLAEEPLIFIRQ